MKRAAHSGASVSRRYARRRETDHLRHRRPRRRCGNTPVHRLRPVDAETPRASAVAGRCGNTPCIGRSPPMRKTPVHRPSRCTGLEPRATTTRSPPARTAPSICLSSSVR